MLSGPLGLQPHGARVSAASTRRDPRAAHRSWRWAIARRSRAMPTWQAPADAQLVVLRKQMSDVLSSGDALLNEPFDDGRWRQWEMTGRSVIDKACGHDWAERFEYEIGSASFSIVQEYPHEPSPDEQLEDRNNDVRAK